MAPGATCPQFPRPRGAARAAFARRVGAPLAYQESELEASHGPFDRRASCINCAACESECPNTAISAGDPVFLIDATKCTECVGAYDSPRCLEVCPIDDAIVPHPEWREPREQLLAKYERLHAAA